MQYYLYKVKQKVKKGATYILKMKYRWNTSEGECYMYSQGNK